MIANATLHCYKILDGVLHYDQVNALTRGPCFEGRVDDVEIF